MTEKKGYPSPETVATIKGMVARGDRQMDVAVYFGLNQARINELVNCTGSWGKAFKNVNAAELQSLPEPGPYAVVGKQGYEKLRLAAAIPVTTLDQICEDVAFIKRVLSNAQAG